MVSSGEPRGVGADLELVEEFRRQPCGDLLSFCSVTWTRREEEVDRYRDRSSTPTVLTPR